MNIDRLGEKLDGVGERLDQATSAINGHPSVAQAQFVNIAELTKLVTVLAARTA